MFHGAYTALITPFTEGKIDEQAFAQLIEWQIAEGIHGLVPCGTTGESPTLTHEEHNRVVSLCTEIVNKRVPVIAGAGSNSTQEAINMTAHAKDAGADAVLIATPYYNKPSSMGLYAHFKAVHDAVDLPIILYNIPGRSVVDMSDALIRDLVALPKIVGIKDATGDVARISSLRLLLKDKEFCYLSGEDGTAVAYNAQGGNGVISVTANIAPKLCSALQEACLQDKYAQALSIHEQLMPLHMAMFCETSPSPVKYAASLMGLCQDELRLPMVLPTKENQASIQQQLRQAGLLG